jgi:hypothetical protein
MPKMKIAVPKPGADFKLQEREIPQPGPGQVRKTIWAYNATVLNTTPLTSNQKARQDSCAKQRKSFSTWSCLL